MGKMSINTNIMKSLLINSLRLLIRPLMRFCLRHDFKIQEIVETCKIELLLEARSELESKGDEVTQSRLSIMTGLQRKDVARLIKIKKIDSTPSLPTRVLGLWTSSKRYIDNNSNPRILKIEEFYGLVSLVSKDLNPRTVLDELNRTGSIKITDENVEVIRSTFIPKGNFEAGFKIAANDLGNLIDAVDQNLLGKDESALPHHHLRTEFDRIRPESLEEIKKWLLIQGKEFHLKVRSYLSQFDQDINPQASSENKECRVSITSFTLSELSGEQK